MHWRTPTPWRGCSRRQDFDEVSIARVEKPFEADAAQLADQGPAAAALRSAGAGEEVRARFVEAVAEALGGAVPRGVALIATAVRR